MSTITRILLVEDSRLIRAATEKTLAKAGFAVITAADGEQALQMARERQPDLILLDMLLPKMAGQDVLRALKKDPATNGIPVVVVSGLSAKNFARLQADGAFAYLEKSMLDLEKGTGLILDEVNKIVSELRRVEKTSSAGA
jgi:CheY-like chemotaxis protein